MSAIPKQYITPEEYLAIERAAPFRSEYFKGEMFAMAGTSFPHNLVNENLSTEINSRLKGGKCHTLSRDMRVLVEPAGLFTYPDLIILCGPPEFYPDADLDTLLNPQVLFEVLSRTSELYDRGAKFEFYRRIASLKEYVLVSQDRCRIERYVRDAENNWLLTEFGDANGTFSLGSLPVQIPMSAIYANVKFPETAPPLRVATPPPI